MDEPDKIEGYATKPDEKLYIGLLGATGRTTHEAEANRLAEIERRILRIETMIWPLGR